MSPHSSTFTQIVRTINESMRQTFHQLNAIWLQKIVFDPQNATISIVMLYTINFQLIVVIAFLLFFLFCVSFSCIV